MQADLRRLEVLIEGWSQADEIPAVERDLALEKLRSLYEAIRFAAPGAEPPVTVAATTAEAAPETVPGAMPEGPEEELPESLDLGAVLSLDGFPDLAETEGPIYAEPADPFGVGELEAEKSAPAAEPETVPAAEPEPVPAVEVETVPAAEAEPVPAVEVETVPAAEAEPAPAAEPETAAAPVVEPEVAPVGTAEPEATPVPAPEPTVTLDSEPTVTPDPESAAEPATPKAHHASPTLFGLEDEETSRHRHKQRVIMSLYGPSPVSERTPVSPRHSAPKAAPASPAAEPAAAGQPFEVIDITESPESFVELADVPAGTVSFQSSGTAGTEPAQRSAEGEDSAPETAAEIRPEAQPSTVEETTAAAPAVEPLSGEEASDDEAWLSEETISVTEQPAAEPQGAEPQNVEPRPVEAEPAEPAEPAESVDLVESAGTRAPEPRNEAVDSDRVPGGSPSIPASGAVLGEVINHDVQTLADTIAPPHDIASELRRSEPVTDLRQAIGLNDKFLLIRDLFDGDGEAFGRAIDALNGFDNLDDCMIYIAEHYAWNPNSDGAKLMMELLERKFA